MKHILKIFLLLSITAVLLTGCATPPRITGRTAYVHVLSQNTVSIQGKKTARMMVVSKLKAAGATSRTQIEISLSGKASSRAVKSLENNIRRAGFRNISVIASVKVSDQGIITIGGKRTAIAQIGAKLKSTGATSNTRISLSFGKAVSKRMMTSITNAIVRSGFPRILVARKMTPTASVRNK